jgi:hypothetical protein
MALHRPIQALLWRASVLRLYCNARNEALQVHDSERSRSLRFYNDHTILHKNCAAAPQQHKAGPKAEPARRQALTYFFNFNAGPRRVGRSGARE